MMQCSNTECGHWQPQPISGPLQSTPQLFVLMPMCSEATAAPCMQAPWQPTINWGEFVAAGAPQPFVAPPIPVSLSQLVNCHPEGQQPMTDCRGHCEHLTASTLPEAVTPPMQRELADLIDLRINDWGDSEYEFSECDQPEETFPRDAKSYASSDTASTTVSKSAKRRRGRRATKSNACKNSMMILETAVPDELLVSEQKKKDLMQQLEGEGITLRRAIANLQGSVLRMSLEPFGCRIIQKALDVANAAEKEALVTELRDHVRLAICSPHGNFVIQKVIEVLPIKSAGFVSEELATFASEVARHRFGCRVLSRLVEHHLCGNGAAPSTDVLIDEVLLEIEQLIHHNFARHVLELILEHGTDVHRRKIALSVRANLFHYAKNRFASYVVEKALVLCTAEDTHAIASELLSDPERFLMLAVHECGVHVVKAVMKYHADCAQKAKELLLSESNRVKSSKYGKRLLDEM